MYIETQSTLKDLALRIPGASRIFEKYGLDYCCGGEQTLASACETVQLAPLAVLTELESAQAAPAKHTDWTKQSVSALIEHILATHHVFTRNELVRLNQLMAKVRGVHSARHPELIEAEALFQSLHQDLMQHMMKEEQVLFPYVQALEAAVTAGQLAPRAMFGTVRNPIQMMSMEHDAAGEMLREMRRITQNFALPPEACSSYRALYQALQEFEADLHEHIHLENNLLFPRAIALESGASELNH